MFSGHILIPSAFLERTHDGCRTQFSVGRPKRQTAIKRCAEHFSPRRKDVLDARGDLEDGDEVLYMHTSKSASLHDHLAACFAVGTLVESDGPSRESCHARA